MWSTKQYKKNRLQFQGREVGAKDIVDGHGFLV